MTCSLTETLFVYVVILWFKINWWLKQPNAQDEIKQTNTLYKIKTKHISKTIPMVNVIISNKLHLAILNTDPCWVIPGSWAEDAMIGWYIPHWDYDMENCLLCDRYTQAVRPGNGLQGETLLCVGWRGGGNGARAHCIMAAWDIVIFIHSYSENISDTVRYVSTRHTLRI